MRGYGPHISTGSVCLPSFPLPRSSIVSVGSAICVACIGYDFAFEGLRRCRIVSPFVRDSRWSTVVKDMSCEARAQGHSRDIHRLSQPRRPALPRRIAKFHDISKRITKQT